VLELPLLLAVAARLNLLLEGFQEMHSHLRVDLVEPEVALCNVR